MGEFWISGTRTKDSGGSSREPGETDAGFWRRCLAYLIDLAAIYVVALVLVSLGERVLASKTLSPLQDALVTSIGGLLLASYFIGLWMNGGTIGQRMLGLSVVGSHGLITFRQAVSRLIALVVVQIVVLGFPFAFVFFTVNRLRSRPFWHDTVSGTRVTVKDAAIPQRPLSPGGFIGSEAAVAQAAARSSVEHAPAPVATVVKRPSTLRRAALILLPAAVALYIAGPDLRIDAQLVPEYGCVSGSMTRAPSGDAVRGDLGACSTGGSPVIISRSYEVRSVGLYLNHPEWRVFDVGVAGVRGFGTTWYGR